METAERNEKIKGIIYDQLLKDWTGHKIKSADDVKPTHHLTDDLGADSLDLVELIMGMEEYFDCEISDERAEKLMTVQACFDYAEEYKLSRDW